MILNLAEVSYHGLTESERKEFEKIIWAKVTSCRSSVLSDYPRGTTKKDFGKLTLCSHKEKVGIMYYLILALHDERGQEIFGKDSHQTETEVQQFSDKKESQSVGRKEQLRQSKQEEETVCHLN
jgi:hypothetical protein